ncbi:hypothetical protein [Arthrobacter sp. Soil736]|uniref:hypothetical protein n=1 Tax=Arthrobacter sp. Soil736 TaxID=1736395 RepID=UPI0012F93687|nr:hypothetical protein [Arthrobacter sp. Soil736]
MPFYTFGHSFVAGDGEVVGSRWVDRMQSWLRTLPQVNNAQNGSTSAVIAARVLSSWTPGTRGLVASWRSCCS